MNKILRFLATSHMLIWSTTTFAVDLVELNDIEQSGTFIQQKHLKILTRPFVTEGKYAYSKAKGLSWETTLPSKSELTINATGVFEILTDGSKKLLTNDNRFSQLLLAIFSGNQQQLLAQFKVINNDKNIVLIPLDEQVKALFSVITLDRKDDAIAQIKLDEPSGNSTVISLTPNEAETLQD